MTSRKELANAIRALSMDAVQKANSGHPGMPMGMADIAEVLWNDFLKHNPANPHWSNRDRFILSNGHGSMLQYALLHLTGYDLSIEDIKQFRQLHSKTPGHPEYGYTPGVETTTGPLGQGIAHGVGMAIAERALAAQFNRPNFNIVDHYTYVFMGDGCMMEGISHEVCSYAGTQKLGKLIAFWDDNEISIDGHVSGWFTDNTPQRFLAYGWQVIANVDGHNPDAIYEAIQSARAVTDKPSLICCRTVIAYGAPHAAGTHEAHGAALGEQEVAATRKNLGWNYPPFEIPENIYAGWNATEKGATAESTWQKLFDSYTKQFPELSAELLRRLKGELPASFNENMQQYIEQTQNKTENIATRKASQNCLHILTQYLPELIGGSADLTGSNLTLASDATTLSAENPGGNYLYYGVREFGMSAMMCGLALHGGFIPFGGTFLVFCDYARNAVRLAALMKRRVIFVYTHDSIGLGEDGPTHQPIEHIGMLRLTPQLSLWRPCDAVESAVAWQMAIDKMNGPTCLLFSRQALPQQTRDKQTVENIKRGGYILKDCAGTPDAILISTGSEVSLAVESAKMLEAQGKKIRIISMPSTDVFDHQSEEYRQMVLPKQVTARIAIEAGAKDIWYKYVGLNGKIIGINRFGESAPAPQVYQTLGITKEAIIEAVLELI